MRLLYCYFNNLNGIKDISISFTGEYLFDTQILKQVALHEGDIDVNTPLMSMVLDEENITLDSNQNIEITANEVLNLGRSEFKYLDKNNVEQTEIEETTNITIEAEELCTVCVTPVSTVVELNENNFIMPLDKVTMYGYNKSTYSDASSEGQVVGEERQHAIPIESVTSETEKMPESNKPSLLKRLGKVALAVAVGCLAVACLTIPQVRVVVAVAVVAVAAVAGSLLAGHLYKRNKEKQLPKPKTEGWTIPEIMAGIFVVAGASFRNEDKLTKLEAISFMILAS